MKRGIAIAIAIVGFTTAPAGALPRAGTAAFSGSCAVVGTVHFQSPLTIKAQPARDLARARGTCSGTLKDPTGRIQHLVGAPVGYIASDAARSASCELSAGATGTGRLVFPTAVVRFRLAETRVAALSQLTLTGRRSGSAFGVANVSPSANLLQIVQDCAGGGLPQTPVELHFAASGISG